MTVTDQLSLCFNTQDHVSKINGLKNILYCVCILLSAHLLSNQTPLYSLLQWSESLQLSLSNPIKWILIKRILGIYYDPTKNLHKLTLSHKKRGLFYKWNKPKLMRFWVTETSFKVFNIHTIHINTHIQHTCIYVHKNQLCLYTMTLMQYHIWKLLFLKFAFHDSSAKVTINSWVTKRPYRGNSFLLWVQSMYRS